MTRTRTVAFLLAGFITSFSPSQAAFATASEERDVSPPWPSIDKVLAIAGFGTDWLACSASKDCALLSVPCTHGRTITVHRTVNLSHVAQAETALDQAYNPPGRGGVQAEGGTCASDPVEPACESGLCVVKPR